MLRALDIRDMLIIDRLELSFQPGLNVLTGETGAGKSILLDCLGFVLGWRGRAELVRQGADQGEVTAAFDLPSGHAARAVLAEAGLPNGAVHGGGLPDDGQDSGRAEPGRAEPGRAETALKESGGAEPGGSGSGLSAETGAAGHGTPGAFSLILRRVNAADGRKTAWVNDRRVSGEVLRALSETLVELHGQQDDRGLLNPRGHRQMLDSFAGVDKSPLRAAWRAMSDARTALAGAERKLAAARGEEAYLRHAVTELDLLDPRPGEDAALDAKRRLMQGAARIRDDIARAHAALGSDGAESVLVDAGRRLDSVADRAEGRLDGAIAALGRALAELGEAERSVGACLDALDFDPSALEAAEERLFAIRALARKHGVAADDLGTFAADLRLRLQAVDDGAGQMSALQAAVARAQAAFQSEAAAMTRVRLAAAVRLDAAMAGELAPLKLDRAVFATVLSAADPGPDGTDDVAFTVATNPGAPAGPLDRIASGGELSRFLLALKVCLSHGSAGVTMIFDEIDRGVGGATADAVGRRLAALATTAQVLVVTHSPQVAARGAHHWRVEKRVDADATFSTVVPLDAGARIDEIARMLSGDQVTDAARSAARVLLAG